jgi:two-component system phosphate regulon sensor histidine kinase PhoR
MKINTSSFQCRLIVSYALVIIVSFGLSAFLLDRNQEANSLQDIKASLIREAYLVESQIPAQYLKNENADYLEALVKRLSPKINARITIINSGGKVLADSGKSQAEVLKMDNHAARPEIKSALSSGVGEEIHYSRTLKMDMLYIALPIRNQASGVNQEVIGVVRLALPLASVQRALSSVRKTIFLASIFALGLAFALVGVLTGAVIKPINKIIHVSRKFSEGDFNHKILVDSRDELGQLAATLNKMAASLQDKIGQVEIQNQHLRAILENMVEGIIVSDKSGRIVSANPSVEKIFGVATKDAQGKSFLEVIRNNDLADIMGSVLKSAKFISREFSLVWPVRRILRVDASPIFERGVVSGCLLVIHDITQIRDLETVRRDFVANVSHELKTPLTSIKGFVETLLEGALEDKDNSRHFLQIIQDHSNRLDSLVHDLLDLAYLESPEIRLEKEKVNVKALADDALACFKSHLNKSSIKAENNLADDLIIRVDKDKISQALTNLVDNAIKFNRENGFIKIYNQNSDTNVMIAVEDSGIGIPKKDIPRIFERFYRADKARSRELGGTGLGLAIVKHIVELHNGSVGVESTEGLGSKFWFILPK